MYAPNQRPVSGFTAVVVSLSSGPGWCAGPAGVLKSAFQPALSRWLAVGLLLVLSSGIRATDASDDPLPPAEPVQPQPSDWTAWVGVGDLVGVSQAEADFQYDHEADLVSDHRRSRNSATVFLRLQPDSRIPGASMLAWRVVEAVGSGTTWSTQHIQRQSGGGSLFDYTEQGSYAGPMSLRTDPGLVLDLKDGSWTFMTLGETASPWTIEASGRTVENGNSREISEQLPGGNLEQSWIEGTAPNRPTSLTGRSSLDQVTPAGQSGLGPGTSRLSRRASVTVWPDIGDVEVELTIESLDVLGVSLEQWRPEGNLENPEEPGSSPLRLQAQLRARGTPSPGKPLPEVRRFRFELMDTSREPGVCMNWPPAFSLEDPNEPAEEDDQFDLRFAVEAPGRTVLSPRRQKAGVIPYPIPDVPAPAAQVRLACHDFGAHARLRVVAELADGREVPGFFNGPKGREFEVSIPLRDEGTRIARAWREKAKVRDGDAADNDDAPVGDGQQGDGFSVFEEYRGFRVDGQHVSTDPARKDLFVQVLGALKGIAEPGFRLLEEATREGDRPGLRVWDKLGPREIAASRIMNPNRSRRTPRADPEPQHGVLVEGYTSGGTTARSVTSFEPGGVRRPKTTKQILIDVETGDIPRHVAHELLHAIGVEHHGTDIRYVQWSVERSLVVFPDGTFRRYFLEQRLGRTTPTGPLGTNGAAYRIRVFREGETAEVNPMAADSPAIAAGVVWVAAQGGEHSGTESCILRYTGLPPYVPAGGPPDVRILPDPAREFGPQGRQFLPRICQRCLGTGMNPARYGHAEVGDCLHQICVRDSAPAKPPPKGLCGQPAAPRTPELAESASGTEPADRAQSLADGDLLADLSGGNGTAWRDWPMTFRWHALTHPAPATAVALRFADGSMAEAPMSPAGVWWISPEQSRAWPLGTLVASVAGAEVSFEVVDPPAALSAEDMDRRRRLDIRGALDAGRWEDARGMAAAWIARDPLAPRPHLWLGQALAGLGRSGEALGAYGAAVARSPVIDEPPVALNRTPSLLWRMLEGLPTLPPPPTRTSEEWDAWFVADPRGQWASSATASSEYASQDYSASRATGAPDVPRHGDDRRAWATRLADDGPEWLQVTFARPVRASGVRIRQTYNPGAVSRVEVIDEVGRSTTVFEGVDAPGNPPNQIAWFLTYFEPTPTPVVRVRISLDTARVRGWNEIDAVQLVEAPELPAVPPSIGSVAYDPATQEVELRWETVAGSRYAVQSAPGLSGPWAVVVSGQPAGGAPGGPVSYRVPITHPGPVFLRVLREGQ